MSQVKKASWLQFWKRHIIVQVITYVALGFILLILLGGLEWMIFPKIELAGPVVL